MSAETRLKRECRICSCTERDACLGSCHWSEKDLCSTCAEMQAALAIYMGIAGPMAERSPADAKKHVLACIAEVSTWGR